MEGAMRKRLRIVVATFLAAAGILLPATLAYAPVIEFVICKGDCDPINYR
jgi:hypothetical protein